MAMNESLMSETQSELFQEISKCGDLLLSCGPTGISADIFGSFSVKRVKAQEDRLMMGEGTHHVHINWNRLKTVRVEDKVDAGKITFLDGEEQLFVMWSLKKPFPASVARFGGRALSG